MGIEQIQETEKDGGLNFTSFSEISLENSREQAAGFLRSTKIGAGVDYYLEKFKEEKDEGILFDYLRSLNFDVVIKCCMHVCNHDNEYSGWFVKLAEYMNLAEYMDEDGDIEKTIRAIQHELKSIDIEDSDFKERISALYINGTVNGVRADVSDSISGQTTPTTSIEEQTKAKVLQFTLGPSSRNFGAYHGMRHDEREIAVG
ncbi:MAG: hypothetical protein N4A38_02860 [Candidatus Gracilibacteria bacterium]|nr:hypothetical protein [Candidatus Gracilibacteria bacterium]